jgi:hypothetical protein
VLGQEHVQNNKQLTGVRWPAPLDQNDRNKPLPVCRLDSRATSNEVPESKQAIPRQIHHSLSHSTKFNMKARLVETSFGRVLLHLVCLCRDGHLRWHIAGVLREFHHSASI